MEVAIAVILFAVTISFAWLFAPEELRLRKHFKRFKEIENLEDDWDTYGAPKFSADHIYSAKSFMLNLFDNKWNIKDINPTSESSIVIGAHKMSRTGNFLEINVEIDSSGECGLEIRNWPDFDKRKEWEYFDFESLEELKKKLENIV